MAFTHLFLGLVFTYLIGAALSLALHRNDRSVTYASFMSSFLASVFGIIFSLSVMYGDTFVINIPGSSILQFGVSIDKLSAFFILVISITSLAVSIYSIGYVTEYFGKKDVGYLGFLFNIFILSMILVVSVSNAVMFIIVWELMSIISYFLVIYEHEKSETRKAGLIYIIMTHVGTGFIILSFLVMASVAGSFNFESFKGIGGQLSPAFKDMAFLFALIGFGTKAGIVPLHIWLPYAHPAAPSNVSALMSGVMIKTAIYMMIRFFFEFLGVDTLWWGILLLLVASISSLLGVMYALMEHDIKRLLAYHSVENIGIILIGLSVSMIFMSARQPELAAFGLIAALYHLINHAMFKSLLFMGAGSIIFSTHTKDIESLGGLIKKMPWTAFFFLIGSMSISALPPFNGFVSEWLTFHAQLLSTNLSINLVTILVLGSGAALALTSALAAACFVKAFGISFLALPRTVPAENAKEVPNTMLAGMGILSFMCIVFGISAYYVVGILDSLSEPIVGIGIASNITNVFTIGTIPSFAGSISTTWIALLLILFMPLPIILFRSSLTSKYETWGCGQPRSTARNEYTATAFSKPIRKWLENIYRPHREIYTTYANSHFFKTSFKFESHIEDVFEQYLYNPFIELTLAISRSFRVIQTGSIHAYLAYIFAVLMILLISIITGGI
ncbi:MAG: hydrogenase 4 subunit B [Methanosarcinaceae archaeon]|nr:hydrogenase 4 subunit B [Methanosarcinaceae archaeon]